MPGRSRPGLGLQAFQRLEQLGRVRHAQLRIRRERRREQQFRLLGQIRREEPAPLPKTNAGEAIDEKPFAAQVRMAGVMDQKARWTRPLSELVLTLAPMVGLTSQATNEYSLECSDTNISRYSFAALRNRRWLSLFLSSSKLELRKLLWQCQRFPG